jgi:hypothetical protein
MTTVENRQLQDPAPRDDYDPDDVGYPNSPPLQPVKVNLQPTATHSFMGPLPPPVSPRSSPSSLARKGLKKQKAIPSQSDAGLVSMMANGAAPEISDMAGRITLADAEMDDDEPSLKAVQVDVNMDEEELEEDSVEEEDEEPLESRVQNDMNGVVKADLALAVQALAAQAVEAMRNIPKTRPPEPESIGIGDKMPHVELSRVSQDPAARTRIRIPSIFESNTHPQSPPQIAVRLEPKSPGSEELPPIRQGPDSPMANGNGGTITLPSISASLANIGDVVPNYAHSPPGPGRPPPMFSAVSSHGSPPKSPLDTFRRELPSPGRPYYYSGHRRPSNSESAQYSSANDYSSSNTETPSTDTSAATPAIDRMSIDGITNPQIGGFQCTYPGCNAQPFQTQVGFILFGNHSTNHNAVSVELTRKCTFFKSASLL